MASAPPRANRYPDDSAPPQRLTIARPRRRADRTSIVPVDDDAAYLVGLFLASFDHEPQARSRSVDAAHDNLHQVLNENPHIDGSHSFRPGSVTEARARRVPDP